MRKSGGAIDGWAKRGMKRSAEAVAECTRSAKAFSPRPLSNDNHFYVTIIRSFFFITTNVTYKSVTVVSVLLIFFITIIIII